MYCVDIFANKGDECLADFYRNWLWLWLYTLVVKAMIRVWLKPGSWFIMFSPVCLLVHRVCTILSWTLTFLFANFIKTLPTCTCINGISSYFLISGWVDFMMMFRSTVETLLQVPAFKIIYTQRVNAHMPDVTLKPVTVADTLRTSFSCVNVTEIISLVDTE